MADEVPDSAVVPTALAYTLGGEQGVRNPELAERYRNEYKTRGEKFALDYEDVMSKRQAEVENAKRILDETAAALRAGHTGEGPGQMNLPLLQMAAGFFKPTRSGNFGEEFGNALSGLAGGIGNQRMRDDEFNRGMADLTLKRSSFEQEPLKDRAALLKAQQLQQEKGQQAIETAQMKTAAGGSKRPAELLVFDEWVKDPKNVGKTVDDYKKEMAVLSAQKTANQKELADLQKKFPEATIDDLYRIRAREAARGKAIGEDTGKVTQALPKFEALVTEGKETINMLLNDKDGMKDSVGKLWATVPGLPGTPKRRWEANYDKLMGEVFGAVYEELRGAGQITEMESLTKIKGAVASSRYQSPEDFANALRRYERQLEISRNILREKAGKPQSTVGPPAANTQQAPAPGGGSATPPLPSGWEIVDGPNGPVYRQKKGP